MCETSSHSQQSERVRCARDSDWCDGVICADIGNPGCPNADPIGLKSTCEKRPACGCSVECRIHAAAMTGKQQP